MTITPEEKFERLENPTCFADYGLSLTLTELETFDKGRQLLKEFCDEYAARNMLGFTDHEN